MKVSELSGVLLDYWVAKALGDDPKLIGGVLIMPWGYDGNYHPAHEWVIAGPILESERIQVTYLYEKADDEHGIRIEDCWEAIKTANGRFACEQGRTYLEAGMRCYVASKFGDEVPITQDDVLTGDGAG